MTVEEGKRLRLLGRIRWDIELECRMFDGC